METPVCKKAAFKCPEIPVLENYGVPPSENFWEKFPSNKLTTEVKTPVNVEKLVELVESVKSDFTCHQFFRAKKCIENFRKGASAFQKKNLPSVFCKNVPSAVKNGPLMTDTIGTWVKKDFAAGPFSEPPLKNFRVNPLVAIEQHGKVRPVLNVSEPCGRSFNDNVDSDCLEKVYMSSAKDFGFTLCKAGKNATFSKFDLSDAYKIIPCKISDLRLQGFSWLNKFFVEQKQIFGAKTSVSNYDIFGHTILDICIAKSRIPANLTHRRLDDVPVIGPENTDHCEKFSATYIDVCKMLNVSLAPACPLNDKAFVNEKFGKVLGINFFAKDLTWQLPIEKKIKCINAIEKILDENETDLLSMQKLMGRLNDVGQMCPFMQLFKKPLNEMLSFLQNNVSESVNVTPQARKDLLVWAGMLSMSDHLPIPREPSAPPLQFIHLSSDAAGVAEGEENSGAGVGGIGLDREGRIMSCFQFIWDNEMITVKKDSKGARFGSKTSMLEMVGLVIPFLLDPVSLKNQHVVLSTDNMGCFFGIHNMAVKEDICASILVRALMLMAIYLKTTVHVEHVPRVSTWESSMADMLSRRKTTKYTARKLLNSFKETVLPGFFELWLADPKEDWSLSYKCLEYVRSIC